MGIDIYCEWKGMTAKERRGQITGFSVVKGDVGYLREAYHGTPYATRYFVKEAFDSPDGSAKIPASVLKKRVKQAMKLCIQRQRELYGDIVTEKDEVVQSYANFAKLAALKEKEKGEPCTIIASY